MKLSRWKGAGDQRREYFERTSVSSFRMFKTKKPKQIKKTPWPRLHTDSSEIKHAEFISSEASGVQLWVSVVIHVEKTIARQMPCVGLLLFPSAFALLQCSWGGASNVLFQKTMCSRELSVPICKEQICSVQKTFCLSSQHTSLEQHSELKLCHCYFTATVKSSVVVSTLSDCFWGCSSAVNSELSYSSPNPAIFVLSHPVPFLKLFA